MDVWFLVDVLFLFAGCYLISIGVKAKLSGDLKDLKQVMPKYAHPGRCQDAQGFLQAVLPWLFLFGGATALNGLLSVLQDVEIPLPSWLHLGSLGLFAVTAVLFVLRQRDAVGKFWEEEDRPDQQMEKARKAKREAKRNKKGRAER